MNVRFLVATSLIVLIQPVASYFVTVDAHAEECFFEETLEATIIGLTFEVAEGGFFDIDVEVNSVSKYSLDIVVI